MVVFQSLSVVIGLDLLGMTYVVDMCQSLVGAQPDTVTSVAAYTVDAVRGQSVFITDRQHLFRFRIDEEHALCLRGEEYPAVVQFHDTADMLMLDLLVERLLSVNHSVLV